MGLEELQKSLSDLSDEELQVKFQEIRMSRRQPVQRKKTTAKKTKEVKVAVNPKTMSSDQAAELLKLLGEGD